MRTVERKSKEEGNRSNYVSKFVERPSKPANEQRGTRFSSRSTRRSFVGQLALLQNEEFEVWSHQREGKGQ
jgi:hypothetical protein